ncbi:hypothetical protein EST38_g4306 [Candolleomyces aberdarensis]|uniref:Protein kinase domain-containing protein n=1 Tax=Candolleomyces aberdarensis TaxID=2316362 RepID=A0A4Q2DMX5_9AGAR|nr:hypothetical protein EST38_g4306 [Candolleomyces aberdarensis]
MAESALTSATTISSVFKGHLFLFTMIIFPGINELSPSSFTSSTSDSSTHDSTSASMASSQIRARHQSTPIKAKLGNSPAFDVKVERSLIKSNLAPYCHSNIDLVDFAVHVWGVERDTAVGILGGHWILDDFQKQIYRKVLSSSKFKETDLHEPFRKMAEALLGDMSQKGYSVKPCIFWDGEGKTYLPTTRPATRNKKPDMLTYDEPAPPKPTWGNVRNVYEFKKKPPPKRPEAPKAKRLFKSLPPLPEDRPLTLDCSAAGPRAKKVKGSTKAPGHKKAASQYINPLKRPSDSDAGDSQGSNQATKRQKFVQSHQQAAAYALECFAANSRYYVVCIVINSWDITVLYFDHTLVLQVAEFNFEADVGALALVLYGTHVCDRRHAGFDPNLRAGPTSEDHPVETPIGSYFHLEHPLKDNAEGRRTAIAKTYKVTDVLASTRDLIGRATAVYKVRECSPNNELSPEHYALKLSWPLKSRVSEIDVIQRLKDRLPAELHAHLPSLEFSTDFDAERLQLPWLQLDLELSHVNHQERIFRVLSEKMYTKLWEAGSVEAFKQAWLDCVECHHQAWEVGKTMHRDLSENNLMLYWDEDGTVKGVLNDWDMASFTDEERDATTAAHHRTGTPPFMAMDLLDPDKQNATPRHAFRHELESLFYILLWAALHYDISGKVRCETQELVKAWEGSLEQIHAAKTHFWVGRGVAPKIFELVRPEFSDVFKNWIRPLWLLFRKARTALAALENDAYELGEPFDEEKAWEELITFDAFMACIGAKPRWAKKGIAN